MEVRGQLWGAVSCHGVEDEELALRCSKAKCYSSGQAVLRSSRMTAADQKQEDTCKKKKKGKQVIMKVEFCSYFYNHGKGACDRFMGLWSDS